MKEITVLELKQKLDSKEDIQLIDVREEYEYEIANIGAELIPLATVLDNADRIPKDKPVQPHCSKLLQNSAGLSDHTIRSNCGQRRSAAR